MAGAFRYDGPSPMGLAAFVQQQGQMGKQQGEDSRLARLVSGAMSDPSARKSNLAEIASFRPEAAFQAQDQFAQQDDRKYAELGKRAAVLAGAPEAMRGQVWAQLRPELEQTFGMQGLPAEVTPEILQTAQQLARVYGGQNGDNDLPSSVREAMAFQADPSLLETRRQMYGSYSYGEVPLPDGTVGQSRRNSRTGEMELVLPGGRVVPMAGATPTQGGAMPMPQGQPSPQPQQPSNNGDPKADSIMTAANAMVRAGVPQPQVEAFIQQSMSAAGLNPQPAGQRAPQMVPTGVPAPAPQRPTLDQVPINEYGGGALGGGFGRRPEDEAAAVEAAKLRTQLGFAPEQARVDADAARQKKEAELLAERNATADKKAGQAQETLSTLEDAIALLPNATGSRLGAARDAVLAVGGISTEGAQASAQLRLLAAKLIANVPRFEGPQSNIDVQFYREAAGDLANETLPVDTRLAAAQKMKEIAQRYAQGGSQSQQPAQSGGRIRYDAQGNRI
jgi:hypothetical protein